MSDKEKVLNLFNELGLRYTIEGDFGYGESIILEGNTSEKVKGYNGFYCSWTFNDKGDFMQVGIYE